MKTMFLTVMFAAYLMTLIGLGVLMGGCAEVARKGNKALYGIDTRPVVVRNGPCVTYGGHP